MIFFVEGEEIRSHVLHGYQVCDGSKFGQVSQLSWSQLLAGGKMVVSCFRCQMTFLVSSIAGLPALLFLVRPACEGLGT